MIIGEEERITSRLICCEVIHIGFETFKCHIEFIRVVSEVDSCWLCCWLAALWFKLNESTGFRTILPARVI